MSIKKIRNAMLALSLGVSIVLAPGGGATAEVDDEQVSIWRVFVDDGDDVAELAASNYDLLEARGEDYLLVIGEADVATRLRADGFRVSLDQQLAPAPGVDLRVLPGGQLLAEETYYGGYRTVDEHLLHLNEVAGDHPGLATLYDYGDSWRKVNGQAGPNDLMVICLTNQQPGDCALNPNSTKPRAVIMAAIHARELQTAEVAWRLIDELTLQYGTDADITHMLDTTEVWIVPVVNPDGREIVETGGNSPYLQRKNANNSLGNCSLPPTSSNHHGVDLNRNATFGWGGTGTSTNPCAQTYRGTSAASEPEQDALETLFTQLWLDQKGPNVNDPVPASATGTFITIHSYGELILLPDGGPNDTELRELGFRMSHFNGYTTGTGPEILYPTSGTTDDHVYYTLGAAGFTYELSPQSGTCGGFRPAYSCIDSTLWPLNRDALLYSIKVAAAPYMMPLGPTTTAVDLPVDVDQGDALTLTGTVDDDAYGNGSGSVGRPSATTVDAAEYYLDVAPSQGGTPVALSASDGSYNSSTEGVSANIDTNALAIGDHTVFVRGRNADGHWGPVTAASFKVTAPVDDPPVADSQSVGTLQDTPVAIVLTGSDPEGNAVTYAVTSGPSDGTLSGTPPNVTYTPDAGFVGTDSFDFTVDDGALTSAPATVTIEVIDPNAGPVFADDFESDLGWQTDPDGTDTATTGMWERGDPEPTNSNGPKQLDDTTSGSNSLVTGRIAGASVGVNDIDNGVTSIQSPVINLPGGLDLTLSFDYYMAHTSNSSTADFLRVTVVGPTSSVVLEELGAGNDDDGAWERADLDISAFAGQSVRLLVEAADASNGSIVEAGIDTLTIEATQTNTPPSADSQSVSTNEDTAVAVTLTGADAEGDPLTYSVQSGPSNGSLSGSAPNLTYTPDPDVNGSDGFTFVTHDGDASSAPATVSIDVAAVNDAPVAGDVSVTTTEDTPVAVDLVGADVDGDALAYTVVSGPANGSLSGAAPNVMYTPTAGFDGSDSVVYEVSDGSLADQATVSITVTPVATGGTVFFDDFESDLGWIADPSGTDGAVRGNWEVANPEATSSSGPKQLGTTTSGVRDLVTGPLAGSRAGKFDVDAGTTSVRSPDIALPTGLDLDLSLEFYFAHRRNSSSADFMRVTVVGSSSVVIYEELGASVDDDAAWQTLNASLNQFAGEIVYLLIEASDSANGSLVEAGVDDVRIESSTP